jgi:hypothetical protein
VARFVGHEGSLNNVALTANAANDGPYLQHNVFSFASMNPPKADFGQRACGRLKWRIFASEKS